MGFLTGEDENPLAGFTASHNMGLPPGAPGGGVPGGMAAIGGGTPGFNPEAPDPSGAQPVPDNILASISGLGNSGQPSTQGQTAAPAKKRVSILDILGTIADAGAEFGGATGGYQAGLDKRRDDAMVQTKNDWEQKFNQQRLEAGAMTNADAKFTRFGQAARGLSAVMNTSGAAGVAKAWPMLAQQMGLDPEEQEIFAQSLQGDPAGTLEMLQAATDPSQAGSQPKEMTIYKMLSKLDQADQGNRAATYADKIATGQTDQMNPYQAAQMERYAREDERDARRDARDARRDDRKIDLEERTVRIAEAKGTSDPKAAGEQEARQSAATSAKSVVNEMRDAFNRLKTAGGINAKGQSVVGRAGAWAQENLPLAERLTNPEGYSARQDLDRLRTVGLSSLLPLLGGLKIGSKNIDAAKELETWRKAIASATDYESAMRALDGFDRRIAQITAEPSVAKPASSGGGGPRRIVLKPRGSSAPAGNKRLKYNPATGRIE